jgi:carbon-monoxide dehydrogenase large subunit
VNPFDRGSTASRTTYAMGNAVRRASVALLDRLREVAAGVLETAPSNLVFKDGTVAVAGGDPGVRPTYGEIITRHFHGPGELVGNGHYGSHRDHDPPDPATGRSTRPTPFWMYGAVAADVEVDTETGRLTVRRVVNVVDAGKAINPLTCEMQIHGATLQGLGMAVMEDLGFPGGIPSDTSFGRYRIPAFGDLPEIESVIVETPTGDGPFGARGIGEIGLAAVPAAIGNAVHAATGRRVADLPINARELARREEGAR